MVDFQTLNWNLSYVAQILCGLSYKVKSTIYFHNKIFYSYFWQSYH